MCLEHFVSRPCLSFCDPPRRVFIEFWIYRLFSVIWFNWSRNSHEKVICLSVLRGFLVWNTESKSVEMEQKQWNQTNCMCVWVCPYECVLSNWVGPLAVCAMSQLDATGNAEEGLQLVFHHSLAFCPVWKWKFFNSSGLVNWWHVFIWQAKGREERSVHTINDSVSMKQLFLLMKKRPHPKTDLKTIKRGLLPQNCIFHLEGNPAEHELDWI